jgi:hypothetical protein
VPSPGSSLAFAIEIRNFVDRRRLEGAYSKLEAADVYAALNLVSKEIEYEHRNNTEPLLRAVANLNHARMEHRKARAS